MRRNHQQKNVAEGSENKVFTEDERVHLIVFYQKLEKK